jgi:hypothetical protein
MPDVTTLTLNNGVTMPALGLGVFQTPPDETRDASLPRSRAATATSTPPPPTATSGRLAKRYTILGSTALRCS